MRLPQALPGILEALAAHESRALRSFNLTPSENILSPLGRLPFAADIYSRYYFEHLQLVGEWMFWGGIEAGAIQGEFLEPSLRSLTNARHVETRPLSGLNCMTVVISGLCPIGGVMLCVPSEAGGHMCTPQVARRLGATCLPLAMDGFEVDLDALASTLRTGKIDLIYLDQSTQLFPIDPRPLRALIDASSPETVLHVDTSHTNGLVLGGALPNPLEQGADTFGGSTHKTLPGPHKAFVATNKCDLADKVGAAAYDLISHHQVAASISLAITLDEFQHRGGAEYASRIRINAKELAAHLAAHGVSVAGTTQGWTACHQVWARPAAGVRSNDAAMALYDAGILVNVMPGLPTLEGKSLRLSTAELTRLGADVHDIRVIGEALAEALLRGSVSERHRKSIRLLREKLSSPRFCYTAADVGALNLPSCLRRIIQALES